MIPTGPRLGFTLIEIVIALLIGSILTSIAMTSFGNARGSFAVRGAKNTFVSMVARARAQAIEQGESVWLIMDTAGDSAFVWYDSRNQETIRFGGELNVDVRGSSFRLCMNTRGYADPDCNSFSSILTVQFWQNADSTSVQLLPMGQVVF